MNEVEFNKLSEKITIAFMEYQQKTDLAICSPASVFRNGYLSALKELAATDSQHQQLEMPCESDFMAWCAIQHYNQSEAASIYRYIARHIKRVR